MLSPGPRFGSTYEGLKQQQREIDRIIAERFGSTYEGLKHDRGTRGVVRRGGFGSTYEGLKLPRHLLPEIAYREFWQYL